VTSAAPVREQCAMREPYLKRRHGTITTKRIAEFLGGEAAFRLRVAEDGRAFRPSAGRLLDGDKVTALCEEFVISPKNSYKRSIQRHKYRCTRF
jgi:hypothetical protein